MREEINAGLSEAVKARDSQRIATLRLINAAIKDRDIAARGEGREKPSDEDILALLQKMVKQREESSQVYRDAGRADLADQEEAEIEIIKEYLPKPLSEEEVAKQVDIAISETQAKGLRDMGRVVSQLKAKYPGQIDFGKASRVVKDKLAG